MQGGDWLQLSGGCIQEVCRHNSKKLMSETKKGLMYNTLQHDKLRPALERPLY